MTHGRHRPETAGPLVPGDYRASVERIVLIDVEAYDWNCPQHIEPRYTAAELEEALGPLHRRMAELERENTRLRESIRDGRRPPRQPGTHP